MSKRAQLHDGTILEFPDETPDHVMDAAVQRHVSGGGDQAPDATHSKDDIYNAIRAADAAGDAASVKALAEHLQSMDDGGSIAPKFQYNPDHSKMMTDEALQERPTSFLQGIPEGAVKVANNLSRATQYGMDQIGLGGVVDSINDFGADHLGLPRTTDDAEDLQQKLSDASPYQGSGLGRFVGETLATTPLAMLPGGVMTQGALSGAALTDKRDLAGVAGDAVLGATGGAIGNSAMRAASRIVAPVVSPSVRRLLDAGIPLTPGQIVGQGGRIGRGVKRIEDSVSNLPIIGTAIRGARNDGVEAMNRVQVNRSLTPIGEALPAGVATGHDAVAHAGDRLSAAYNDVLPRMTGTIDNQFARRLDAITNRADVPAEYANQINNIRTEARNAFTSRTAGANGRFTGRSLRDSSERLGDIASTYRSSDDPYLRRVGEAAGQVREQLHAMARRQNPADAARLRAIDQGYASLVRTERAAAGTPEGIFTGPQLRTAVRQSDNSVRKRAVSRGQALDQGLARDAGIVMPSTVGEGGSTAINGLGLTGAVAAGVFGGVPGALAAAGATGAGLAAYTRPGQQALQYMLARRAGPSSQYLSNLMQQGAPVATAAGATGGISSMQPFGSGN